MQLIILVYHITGASKDIGIYMIMRLFVSSYLFLNGFGHFSFYWKEKEKEDRKKVSISSTFLVHFSPIFWHQKNSNPKHSFAIFGAKILYKKSMRNMLVKSTQGGSSRGE